MVDFKAFRRANKITQVDAATYLGCTQGFISQIEQGLRPIPEEFIVKILANNEWDPSLLITDRQGLNVSQPTINERIRICVRWLVGIGLASTQGGIGRLMGYYNKSAFSQVVNGQVDLPIDFISRLCKLDGRINESWLSTGEGEMLKALPDTNYITPTNKQTNDMTIDRLLNALERRDEELAHRGRQMDELIDQQSRLISVIETMSGTPFKQSQVG